MELGNVSIGGIWHHFFCISSNVGVLEATSLKGLVGGLIAATMKASIEMFHEPMDDTLWQLVALSAGTGGSPVDHGGLRGGFHSQQIAKTTGFCSWMTSKR